MFILKKIITLLLIFSITTSIYAMHPLIIDTDVGVDDVVAMLYLFNRSDIEIKAITITGDGNAHAKPALKNALNLLKLSNHKNIPIACGRSTPLMYHHHFPESVLTESDTLAGTENLLPTNDSNYSGNAIDLLTTTLKNSNEPIDILAIGPLTNIAELLIKHPNLKNKINRIYIMGGAVHVQGSVALVDPSTKNTVAEWNLFLDPKAADIVFRSGINITLVPLDVTNLVPIKMDFYIDLKQYKTLSGKYLFKLFKKNKKSILKNEWYFWDPLAAVIASDPSVVIKTTTEKLRIVLKPEEQSGATVIDNKNGNNIQVCYIVDKIKFKEILLDKIR